MNCVNLSKWAKQVKVSEIKQKLGEDMRKDLKEK